MTKETIISTFLPIVNIGIRAKSVKSKTANTEIKHLKISVLFLQPIRYHVIDSLQSFISITWDVWPLVPPLSSMCRVSTVYAHRIFVWLGRFSRIRFFIRFWTMENKTSENEEKSSSTVGLFVILDNDSSSRSWSAENWRLVHNQNRSIQTYRSFNQLISNHLKDFTFDDIQTINFLPFCLYYMVLSRSRSPKGVIKVSTASSLLFFFWTR